MNDDLYQIWEDSPQCPLCDGPLEYWTDDNPEDPGMMRPGALADGAIRCCRCSFEEYADGQTESEVLIGLFDRVANEYLRKTLIYEVSPEDRR